MKNLKIWQKLVITFMLVILLFCATVATAILGLKENAAKYSEFYNVEYRVTNNVMNMRRGLQIIVKDLSYITIEEDAQRKQSYLSDMEKELTLLEDNATWLFENFSGDASLLDTFSTQIRAAVEMQQTVIELADADKAGAQAMLLDQYQPLVEEAVNTLIQISSVEEATAETNYLETVDLQGKLESLQLLMAGSALFITILLCLYLTRAITRPLKELEVSAEEIVKGNLDITIKYQSRDELGMLANAFRNMTVILNSVISDASMLLSEMADGNFDVRTKAEENYVGNFQSLLLSIRKLNRDLSSTLGQINLSADEVASSSSQVSGGAQALSQGATEQAAAVQQLAATIANISNQVNETAENAANARVQSNTAGDEMEVCNNQMKDMMSAMEEITRTSNEISKIIKTIEDIAFQTNILALNASVEAARAGTAGKGFAVVANEVRTLASKSSVASKDTASLIERSIEAVERGTQIARSTAESLGQVVEEVRATSSKVDTIAGAAREQASAIEQVTLGVDQISTVVQSNSGTAVESASASQELSDQADTLKELVAKFTLREEYIPKKSDASGNGGWNSRGRIDL